MLILSRVCAEFHDRTGKAIFEITPMNRLNFLEAPEAIQEDPLFSLMIAEGSLEAVQSVDQKRNLESDPVAGTTAEGKKSRKSSAVAAASASEAAVTKKTGDAAQAAGPMEAAPTQDVAAAEPATTAESAAIADSADSEPTVPPTKTTRKSAKQS